MGDNLIWREGEYAYFRNNEGVLYRRKMDPHYKYYPWEEVSEDDLQKAE